MSTNPDGSYFNSRHGAMCVVGRVGEGAIQRNKLPSPAALATLSLSLGMRGVMEDGGTVLEETIS